MRRAATLPRFPHEQLHIPPTREAPTELQSYVDEHRDRLERLANEDDDLGPAINAMLRSAAEGVL